MHRAASQLLRRLASSSHHHIVRTAARKHWLNLQLITLPIVMAAKHTSGVSVPAMGRTDSEAMRKIDHQTKVAASTGYPDTLEGFGYHFNEEGELRNIKTGKPFVFRISDKHDINQKNYEALGEVITQHVYGLLESQAKLKKMTIPVDAKEDEAKGFIFVSDDALTNPDKLLILIHGSGVVRAGQWARKLIINESLKSGTQLPFIERAVSQGYGILVMNTNQNFEEINGKEVDIRGSEFPENHAIYVWQNVVSKAAAKHIAIIAHSYGGIATVELAAAVSDDFMDRVFTICFTDSVHDLHYQKTKPQMREFLHAKAVNWISSDQPLDTPITDEVMEVKRVSSGHPKHENTSWSAFEAIFTHMEKKLKDVTDQATSQGKAENEEL